MDQITLVDELTVDGSRLIEQLRSNDFDVAVAFWLKVSDESNWFLHVASKVVDEVGQREAYRRLNAAIGNIVPELWVSRFDVKLVRTDSPLAKDALEVLNRYPGRSPLRYGGTHLGGVSIDEAYIYPPIR